MLSKAMQLNWDRYLVWFLYVCAQVIVLCALLMTTTSIPVHAIFLILALAAYFLTVFVSPGYYQGPVAQPNHEDTQLSVTKCPRRQKRKKMLYEGSNDIATQKVQPEVVDINEKQVQSEHKEQSEANNQRYQECEHKKTSMDDVIIPEKKFSQKVEKASLPTQNQTKNTQTGKFKFLLGVKSVLGTIAKLGQKSEKQDSEHQVPLDKRQSSIRDKSQQKSKTQKIPQDQDQQRQAAQKQKEQKKQKGQDSEICPKEIDNNSENKQGMKAVTEQEFGSLERQRQTNSGIERQDFCRDQIEEQFEAMDNVYLQLPQTKVKSVVKKIEAMKRYCRICQAYQPLRVKHCHSCQKCITTFDHHCPWLSTCIGQKNKLFFLLYLFFQTLQLLVIFIDLSRYLSSTEADNTGSVAVFLITSLLLFIVLTALFSFHMYLVGNNLTTWEFLRSNKIQYFAIFDRQKLVSPFSKGWKQNLKMFWTVTRTQSQKNWLEQISQDFSKFVLRTNKPAKSEVHQIDSDRRPFRSQKAII